MKRRFDLYLKDILEAIERIEEYTDSMDYEEFSENKIALDAVMRNMEIIGEAATQLSEEVRNKYKEVPWREIQDFRIVVAHHYWKVNKQRIWDIIENQLRPLKQQVEEILAKEKDL